MTDFGRVIPLLFLIANGLALEKGCKMSQLDDKMKPLTKWVREGNWPESEKDVDNICKTHPEYLRSARSFVKKCAKGESKAILSVSIHSIDKTSVKMFCKNKNKSDRKAFIGTGKCANAGHKSASKCWTKVISQITAAANVTDAKSKFPLLCCSFLKWKDCTVKAYEDTEAQVCTPDQIENIDRYLDRAMIDPLNMFCTDYDESDKCNKFESFLASSQSVRVKYATPFPAILALFESF